jgi:5'(3')-deoxyribonucleotidase
VILDIGVDLDECVYPFLDVLRHWIHQDTRRPLHTLPPPTDWSLPEQWGYQPDELHAIVARGVAAGVIFRSGSPIPGALEALRQIADAGHRIHIVTARHAIDVDDVVEEDTRWWVKEYGLPHTSLTFSSDKSVVPTDVLIDDSPDNYAALEAAGSSPWFFDRPWNSGVQGRRVHTWPEFRAVVEERSRHLDRQAGSYGEITSGLLESDESPPS